jgi:hypothetical protein
MLQFELQQQKRKQKRMELFVRLVMLFVVSMEAGSCCCYYHAGAMSGLELSVICIGVLLMAVDCLRMDLGAEDEGDGLPLQRLPQPYYNDDGLRMMMMVAAAA